MDGRARCHTCRGAGAGREPGKIVRRGRTHWGPSGRTLPLHRSARPAHMEGACLSASFHPPAGTAVHGHPPAAPPHKTSPPRKKSGPAARQPPALHHPAPRRRQKVRPNAALPPSFGRCFCPSLSMAGGSGGGRIARQAATIRAAAPLSVSPPAGPARGGRNRRRAYHMAGRGSAPRRQDGVPSAHREAEFSPRIAGGDASQGEVSPTRRWRGIRRRAHRAAGGNHPGSGPVVRQPACRSRAWRAQSPPRMPYGGKGERPAQAGRSSLRAIARQAATIRAAALLTVSRPAGPSRGGRNRRRACHMAGRGSAPRRQDGVPSAQSRGGANARAARKLPKLGLAKARGAW